VGHQIYGTLNHLERKSRPFRTVDCPWWV